MSKAPGKFNFLTNQKNIPLGDQVSKRPKEELPANKQGAQVDGNGDIGIIFRFGLKSNPFDPRRRFIDLEFHTAWKLQFAVLRNQVIVEACKIGGVQKYLSIVGMQVQVE